MVSSVKKKTRNDNTILSTKLKAMMYVVFSTVPGTCKFLYSIHKLVLENLHMPDTVLDVGDMVLNKTDQYMHLALKELKSLVGKATG